jgi:hypothetical protein
MCEKCIEKEIEKSMPTVRVNSGRYGLSEKIREKSKELMPDYFNLPARYRGIKTSRNYYIL